MPSASFLQNKIYAQCLKNLSKVTYFKNRLFDYQYFHTNVSLSHRTASFLTLKKYSFSSIICERSMAGHAKWQNIAHVKAAKDRQKNLNCNKYAYLINMAVREGGSDPKANHKLVVLMEQAKRSNVPMSVVENAIKRVRKEKCHFGSIEILGPEGCIIVLEYETDNVASMRHEIKTICKKYGANILPGAGRWRAVYEQKGVIKAVGQKDGQPLDAEKALDSAIEAGAEEVLSKEDEDEKIFLEFLCAADDLHPVKKELERTYEVEEGYVGYIPLSTLKLESEASTMVDNFLEDLGSMTDIIRIFENVE